MRKHDSLAQSTDHIDEPRSADFRNIVSKTTEIPYYFVSNMLKFRPAAPYCIKTRKSLKP